MILLDLDSQSGGECESTLVEDSQEGEGVSIVKTKRAIIGNYRSEDRPVPEAGFAQFLPHEQPPGLGGDRIVQICRNVEPLSRRVTFEGAHVVEQVEDLAQEGPLTRLQLDRDSPAALPEHRLQGFSNVAQSP